MTRLASIAESLDDWMNPIVVKELRQSVQSKFIVSVLALFLIVQSVIMVSWLVGSNGDSMTLGRDVFQILNGIVVFTGMVVVPIYAAVRLGAERSDTNVDLLFVSSISPASIIWGKFCSAMVLVLLIFSACLPYMTITFLLRGIDIPTISIVLGYNLLFIAIAIQSGIIVGCLPVRKVVKALFALIFIAALFWCFAYTALSIAPGLIRQGIGSKVGTGEFLMETATLFATTICICAILGSLSVAAIMPGSSNRAFYPRLVFTGAWLLSGACAIAIDARTASSDAQVTLAWAILMLMAFAACYLISICERDVTGERLGRSAVGSTPRRILMFLFSSGAAGGVIWTSLMVLATIGVIAPVFLRYRSGRLYWPSLFSNHYSYNSRIMTHEHIILMVLLYAAYAFCYAMTAALLRWYFFRRSIKTQVNAPIALMLAGAGVMIPPVVSYFVSGAAVDPRSDNDLIFLGNPFYIYGGISSDALFDYSEIFIGIWTALIFLCAIPWVTSQFRSFRPPEPVSPAQPVAVTPQVAAIPSEPQR